MVFRAPGNEGLHSGFNWTGKFSYGQEILPGDDETTGRVKEKQVHRLTFDSKRNDDGSLELTQHIPGNELSRCIHIILQHQLTGVDVVEDNLVQRACWAAWHHKGHWSFGSPHIDRDGMTYLPCVYGDKTPIPRKYLNQLIEVIDKEEIHLPLKKEIFSWWIIIKCLTAEKLGVARDTYWPQCVKVQYLLACTTL
ncbi:unnamed protein product [Clonostachys rosea f. rosea IK726]|uniref:Uncharacterized protein n=1 Tax=Clonostachys rosea f. rosea IK726 TaxID=1349383 RepID=A0ACA9U7E1_BIOOC|nr:unnamed protein product [Clonostachys rosea f. rosea IK726]